MASKFSRESATLRDINQPMVEEVPFAASLTKKRVVKTRPSMTPSTGGRRASK